jgi:hypothetical protein
VHLIIINRAKGNARFASWFGARYIFHIPYTMVVLAKVVKMICPLFFNTTVPRKYINIGYIMLNTRDTYPKSAGAGIVVILEI